MGYILLAGMMLVVFAFGYIAVDRVGKFMEKNYRGYQERQDPDRKVFITEAGGKSTEAVSKEISALLDSLSDSDEFEIVICKTADARVRKRPEGSGCTIDHSLRQ